MSMYGKFFYLVVMGFLFGAFLAIIISRLDNVYLSVIFTAFVLLLFAFLAKINLSH